MTATRAALMPIDQIVSMLSSSIERLCMELLPLGHRDGNEWREASTRKGGSGDSLSVHIGSGARRGIWARHGSHEKGDALDLIAYCRFGGDKKAAIGWAKSFLGLDGSAAAPAVPLGPVEKNEAAATEDAEQRRRAAHAIFLTASQLGDGSSPAERYLAGRAIPLSSLPYPVHAVRCHPALWDRHTKRRWPAMIAAISGADGKFLAAHMTYLEVQSDGSVRKAPIADSEGVPQSKRTLGSYRGGAIRLWRGTVTDPNTGEIKQARRLAQCKDAQTVDVTEGIEDGLTVAIGDQQARVMVAVSLSNLANITFPKCVGTVVLWRQNDPPGSKAEAAFERAVDRMRARGLRIAECRPEAGIKDVNDMVRYANSVRLEAAQNK
jgi:hypothetical protein